MSSFKNFSSMLNDLQRQADGRGTLDGSAIEDFLSIAGYKECGGGGGGGGGGDFSTAIVAITNDSGSSFVIPCACLIGGDMVYSIDSDDMDGSDFEIVLYKGEAYLSLSNTLFATVTGDITFEVGGIVVSGNGTITIEASA